MKNFRLLLLIGLAFCLQLETLSSEIERRNVFSKVEPPSVYKERNRLAKTATSTYHVSFSPDFPDSARKAFLYADTIYSFILNTSQPIKIFAFWDSLGENEGANCEPYDYYPINSDTTVKYPVALAEMLLGQDLNPVDSPDIIIRVNKNNTEWYYGTDGRTPTNRIDFVTVIMHEIMHGLGMVGTFNYNSNTYRGSWGLKEGIFGSIFDFSCIAGNLHGTSIYKLMNTSTYPNPSPELGVQLRSGNTYFDGFLSYEINNNSAVKLFCPSVFAPGTSVYHLDSSIYKPGTSNSLMGPAITYATAIHSPGEVGLAILEDLGWSVNRIITVTSPVAKTILQQGNTYTIKWTDNKGGALIIDLYKGNAFGQFNYYTTISSVAGDKPTDSTTWTIPSSIDNGEYMLKMLDQFSGYSFSGVFTITNLPFAATPTFNPVSGRYDPGLTVQISCATSGADIYYTTDLSDPCSSATRIKYISPITVLHDVEIHAQAFKENYNPSEVAIGYYYVDPYISPPIVDPVTYWGGSSYLTGLWIHVTPSPGTVCKYTKALSLLHKKCNIPPDPDVTSNTWTSDERIEYSSQWYYKFRSYSPSTNKLGNKIINSWYRVYDGVTIAQLDKYGNPFGEWRTREFCEWVSHPDNRILADEYLTYNHKFLADQGLKPGTDQKYQLWDKYGQYFYMNHANIPIAPSDNSKGIYARFTSAEHATIKLEDWMAGGTIQFKDPWLIDSTDEYDTPINRGMNAVLKERASPFHIDLTTSYNGDVYRGVFLNQGGDDINNLVPPYYTVRAPAEPLPGFLWTFMGWKGEDVDIQNPRAQETPVVFKAPNATLTARWKAHMAASMPQSHSNQKKIVKIPNYTNWYAMVHESSGEIFHSLSTDGGVTWGLEEGGYPPTLISREELLSDSTGNSSNPSITHNYDPFLCPHETIVVWEENTSGGNGYRIMANTAWNNYGYIVYWPAATVVYENSTARPDAATPVISWTDVYWRDLSGIMYKSADQYGTPDIVPGTDANSTRPAVCGKYSSNYLVWRQVGTGIQYKEKSGSSWYPTYTIARDTLSIVNISPAIEIASGFMGPPYIVWEERDMSKAQSSIKVRTITRTGALSSVTTIFACPLTSVELSPSLNCDVQSGDTIISIVWTLPGGGVGCAMRKDGNWSSPFPLSTTGQYASIGYYEDFYGKAQPFVASKSSAGPPYRLQIDTIPIYTVPQQSMISVVNDWNFVSVPRVQSNWDANVIFPGKNGAVYAYNTATGGYNASPMLANGPGYWVNYTGGHTIIIGGDPPTSPATSATQAGWVLVGSRETPVGVSSLILSDDAVINGSAFRFNPATGGYDATTVINPGDGVWINVSKACTITIP